MVSLLDVKTVPVGSNSDLYSFVTTQNILQREEEVSCKLSLPTPDNDSESNRVAKRMRSEGNITVPTPTAHNKTYHIIENKWTSSIAKQLAVWVDALVELNSKCLDIPAQAVIKTGVATLEACVREYKSNFAQKSLPYGLSTLSAACLWISIKFCAPRSVLPGASFMSIALGVDKEALKSAELFIMNSINWDVYAIAKPHVVVNE